MTPPAELTAENIRNIISEEVPAIVREELAPVEERLTERIMGVERRVKTVEEGVKEIRADIANLREELTGLIDEAFPPAGIQRRSRGRTKVAKVAAKGR